MAKKPVKKIDFIKGIKKAGAGAVKVFKASAKIVGAVVKVALPILIQASALIGVPPAITNALMKITTKISDSGLMKLQQKYKLSTNELTAIKDINLINMSKANIGNINKMMAEGKITDDVAKNLINNEIGTMNKKTEEIKKIANSEKINQEIEEKIKFYKIF